MPLSAEAIIAIFGVVVALPPALILLYRRQQHNPGRQNHISMTQLFTDSVRLLTANNAGISPNIHTIRPNIHTIHKLPGHVAVETRGGHSLALFSARSWAPRQHTHCRSLGWAMSSPIWQLLMLTLQVQKLSSLSPQHHVITRVAHAARSNYRHISNASKALK